MKNKLQKKDIYSKISTSVSRSVYYWPLYLGLASGMINSKE